MQRCSPMARECNIDAKGKFVRLVGGSISLVVGIAALLLIVFGILPENIFTIGSVVGMFAGVFIASLCFYFPDCFSQTVFLGIEKYLFNLGGQIFKNPLEK